MMAKKKPGEGRSVVALKVRQWLGEWDKVRFDLSEYRRKPDPHFYLFALPASELKALTGIQRRTTTDVLARSQDLGIQRRHEAHRSKQIAEFIRYGYPWSDLNPRKRDSGEFDDLRKPGWLPTAIVVNILKSVDERRGRKVADEDLVNIDAADGSTVAVRLPETFVGPNWQPSGLHPLEVIDGQHRLWAFEDEALRGGDLELPVVAFHGLDISWQAYLFWAINIKPKRINASLAFDLYPLLRVEDWLEKFAGHSIYRETRAQELTETLWSHPESPWHQRVNMLGEPGLRGKMVSQAAWIRALMASYVKAWRPRRVSIGGLFGAPVGEHKEALPWSRAEQAAFLIQVWRTVENATAASQEGWATSLRHSVADSEAQSDPAFAGPHTLLSTDQGVRGVLYVTNDLCYVQSDQLDLMGWGTGEDVGASVPTAVSRALESLVEQAVIIGFLEGIADGLAKYDWRTASAPDLSDEEKTAKLAFRGSGGYKELRRQLLELLSKEPDQVGLAARAVQDALGYD